MNKQKLLDHLKSLPVEQQKFCAGTYRDANNVCCVLGTLSPTLKEYTPIIGIDMILKNDYYMNGENFSLKVQKELAEFGLDRSEADQLQVFNDHDRRKNHDQRFKDVIGFIEDNM